MFTPRPTCTRKKTSHICVPVSAMSPAMSASSVTFWLITVVLTCTVTPASTSDRMACTVWSKCPAMPRTPSCVAAHAPSRLIDTALAPQPAIRLIMAGVSRGVTEGDTQTGTPTHVAYLTRSNRSGRSRQSPPVSTRIG